MKIYPAIDLRNGKCVRLEKGDFNKQTEYSDDPVLVAKSYQLAGATYLHVVDLDGAKEGSVRQTNIISEISKETSLLVQAGGGVRTLLDVEALLVAGVNRVVIGSMAIKDPTETKKIMQKVGPSAITLAFDLFVNENDEMKMATHGWQNHSSLDFYELLESYIELGLDQVLCTDISKDGMLCGPNFDLYEKLSNAYPSVTFLASGGISEVGDIQKLQMNGTKGVIIGKALYEKKFTLSEVLSAY